ncbi:hypothetical protein [Aeoliella sp. SH292]|uniref:hypothetical protein n=1 Tax=Aeoliella sp. SH292 TaxID=3454464 RepID=UPI003F991165
MLKRIYTSRWYQWTCRLVAGFLCLLTAIVAVMSVASVDLPVQYKSAKPAAVVSKNVWPARESPALPEMARTGPGPIDLGIHGCCRVLSLANDVESGVDTYLLVTASSPAADDVQGEMVFRGKASVGGGSSDFQMTLGRQNMSIAQVMPATHSAQGTMLYLGSIDILSAGESRMLQRARDQGWNVLACSIGMDSRMPEQIVVDDRGSTRLAQRIDDHLADRAYAMEALIAYVEQQSPELLVGPRVLVGMSAGAIALPTVGARIGDVDAAVVIGGGEHVAEIIACSPLFGQHIELVDVQYEIDKKGDCITHLFPCTDRQKRTEFADAVLQKSKLDPHYSAAALRETPVLMVQAEYDHIVPAAAGEALYETLGRPERWQYRTGHIGLTLLMPWKADYVLDWMATQVAR